jgi:hypothetical protein
MAATIEQDLEELRAEVDELRRFVRFTAARVGLAFDEGYQFGRESVLGTGGTGQGVRGPRHLQAVR